MSIAAVAPRIPAVGFAAVIHATGLTIGLTSLDMPPMAWPEGKHGIVIAYVSGKNQSGLNSIYQIRSSGVRRAGAAAPVAYGATVIANANAGLAAQSAIVVVGNTVLVRVTGVAGQRVTWMTCTYVYLNDLT